MQKSSKQKTPHCKKHSHNLNGCHPAMNKFHINNAASILHLGGVIAYPTESVYGLGCDPQNDNAIIELLSIKKRSFKRGLILIASHIDQLSPYIAEFDEKQLNKVNQTWPGPTTWLLPYGEYTSVLLRGAHPLQAVRVSNHPTVKALCDKFGGAIVSTSANVSGHPAAKTKIHVYQQLKQKVDYILAGNVGGLASPCEIRSGIDNSIIRSSNN